MSATVEQYKAYVENLSASQMDDELSKLVDKTDEFGWAHTVVLLQEIRDRLDCNGIHSIEDPMRGG